MSQIKAEFSRFPRTNSYFDPVEFFKKSIKNYLIEKLQVLQEPSQDDER